MDDFETLNLALRDKDLLAQIKDQLEELEIFFNMSPWLGRECDCCGEPFDLDGIYRIHIGTVYLVVEHYLNNYVKEQRV